ncbi:MAG: fibrillarin-like rRNA/tRNA 2'-O-methyltransferase [Conexivisphaerales archaeon]
MINLIRIGNLLYTKNLTPGISVYGEKLKIINGSEYRTWDPKVSKLAACIIEGFKIDINEYSRVLYLGASSGSSLSHISDIASKGKVFGVEISKEMIARLINLAESRRNIYPIFGDARQVQDYVNYLEDIDFVYQDIPQYDQVDIFLRNIRAVRSKQGLLVVKARSIAVDKRVSEVLKIVLNQLKGINIVKHKVLHPYYADHIGLLISL